MDKDLKILVSDVGIELQCNKCFTIKTFNLFSRFDNKCSCGGLYSTVKTETHLGECPHCKENIQVIKTQNGFKFIKATNV